MKRGICLKLHVKIGCYIKSCCCLAFGSWQWPIWRLLEEIYMMSRVTVEVVYHLRLIEGYTTVDRIVTHLRWMRGIIRLN